MHRLLYISTSRRPITSGLLGDILTLSRRNNAAVGVTGLLVAGGKRFLQVLEGDAEAVRTTYARICADPRHYATVILSDGPIAARAFGRWSMGHVTGGVAGAGTAADTAISELIAPITDPTLRAYFDGFVTVKRAA